MNAKGNPQKRSNKELSAAMIPKIMSGMTSTKSTDNVLLNPVSILVKSEEELGISSMKAVQSNTYKNKDTSNSSIQSTINQIGNDASILYKTNISNAESCDQKPALELCQSNTDSHTISNSDNVSNSNKEIVSCSDAYPQSQNTTINEQKPINSIAIQPIQPRRRGRPRKYVYIQTPEECNNYYPQSHVSNSETSTYCTKNSMDTSVISTNSKSPDSNVKIDTVENDYKPKRRGRLPSKNKGILKNDIKNHDKKEINVDTLDNTHISQLSKLSITCNENSRLTVEQDMTQPVKCMRCGKEIIKNEWLAHNLTKHNNMGWYEGEEPMDFQNDTKLLKRVLSNAIKKKKGQLCCEQCGAVKRSVNGFVSHIQFCGKSDDERRALMVTCPVCNAVMMPSSMEIHERHHRELKYSKRKNFVTEPIENEKVKRKAAERAVSKILQFTESVKEEYIGQPKKVELNSSVLKNVKMPGLKKRISSVWKSIWKKELQSDGVAKCRQPDCKFSCPSYEDIVKHCSECNFTPQENYICKLCKYFTENKEEIIEHMKLKHSPEDNADKSPDFKEEDHTTDESDNESFSDNKVHSEKERLPSVMMFLDDPQALRASWNKFYTPTLHWTMKFEIENYELQLFNDYIPKPFILLNNEDTINYLPPLKVSMATKAITLNSSGKLMDAENEWKFWNTFEGGIFQDCPTFFTGGPVWALAWLPIPASAYFQEPDQYIAVSTHPDMEYEYAIGKAYSGHNIIQIWNLGKLNNEVTTVNTPTLSYAIVHDSSTIWSLEWCPSGCYQRDNLNSCEENTNSLRRMGLLAAAGSNGSVYIYSLPFSEELTFTKTTTNNLPIYKTDPVLILVVNSIIYNSGKQDWQCTKLSWTKECGHNTIAAGFSNGYIALWDLKEQSPLLMQKQNNSIVVNAFAHFFAHSSAISMLAMIPYNNQRYLASASIDRYYKLWDLENISSPQESIKKGIITDGAWMLHWPCAVLGFDDALGYKHTNTYLISLREHGLKFCPLLTTNSPTYTIAISDYANSIAHGSLSGDVQTLFPHQLLYAKDIEKILPRKRQLNSFIKIVDLKEPQKDVVNKSKGNSKEKKSKDYHYMPETYDECKDRFGIIFHNNFAAIRDNLPKVIQQKVLYTEKLTTIPIEQYPFTSVNKIAWNPNLWSHLWLAAGYQNGLVRLLNFSFMSSNLEMDVIIKEHVESMLRKNENIK